MDRNYQDRQRNGHYYREGRGNTQGQGGQYYDNGQNGSQYYGNGQNSGQYYSNGQNGGQYYGNGQNGGQYYSNGPQNGDQYYGYGAPQGTPDDDDRRKNGRKKKKKKTFGDVLSGLLMLVALGVFLYSGYTLYGFYKEYKAGTDEYDSLAIYAENDKGEETEDLSAFEDETAEAMTEAETAVVEENGQQVTLPVMSNPVDFEELQKVNDDIVGWLKVRALDLSYPVVQGEDNDFYLHRTFEKVDNFAGCIFMNSGNKSDLTDQNTIIYGHNMKNGSMFGTLKKFHEEDTFKKSEYFWIFTPDLIYQYHIFSAMTVNKTGLTYQTFYLEDEFQKLIKTAFENSVVDNSGMEVTSDDRIVTLSTCTGDDATRFVVMGKLEQIFAARKPAAEQ